MSKKLGGIDRLIADIQEAAAGDIRWRYDSLEGGKQASPIERLFRVALEQVCQYDRAFGHYVRNYCEAWASVDEQPMQADELYLWQQISVVDWLCDFVVGFVDDDGKRHFAIVECDGHDYHERTKEQAVRDRSRDRSAQLAGYKIFRFTGSELYRDPLACADEVLQWVDSVKFGEG